MCFFCVFLSFFRKGPEAIQVLLEHLENMERAVEFAAYWDQPDVWSLLGKAQLDKELVKDAIVSFLKADDASHFVDVIAASKNAGAFDDLILFLKMARGKIKDVKIDNELLYSYARTDRLADLEDFLAASNIAKVQDVGDLLFNESLYQAARICYTHVNNNAKLAICLVRLKLYAEAVEAARKANNILTWKVRTHAHIHTRTGTIGSSPGNSASGSLSSSRLCVCVLC